MASTPKVHTPATLAEQVGTTPKVFRKFLRSPQGLDGTVGKGARWSITSAQATGLRKRFPAWKAQQDAERAERAQRAADESAQAVSDESDEVDISDETDDTPEQDEDDTTE